MTEPELKARPVVVAEVNARMRPDAYVMLTPEGIVNEDAIVDELADAIEYHSPRCVDFEPSSPDTDAMLAMVDGGNDGRRHVIIEVDSLVIDTHPDPIKIDFDVRQTHVWRGRKSRDVPLRIMPDRYASCGCKRA